MLTASGGALRDYSAERLREVTPEVLAHPTWKMGKKVTVDWRHLSTNPWSYGTHYLFGVPYEKLKVVIHRQSIVHSMVTFVDGSTKAQASVPDMSLAISYGITYPGRRRESFLRYLPITALLHLRSRTRRGSGGPPGAQSRGDGRYGPLLHARTPTRSWSGNSWPDGDEVSRHHPDSLPVLGTYRPTKPVHGLEILREKLQVEENQGTLTVGTIQSARIILAIVLLGILVTFHGSGTSLQGAAGVYIHGVCPWGMGPVLFSWQGEGTKYTIPQSPRRFQPFCR